MYLRGIWDSDQDDESVLDGMLDGKTCSSSFLDYSTVSTSLKILFSPPPPVAVFETNEQNNPIDVEQIPVLQTNKPPFKITIKPRSKAHADLIMKACAYAADPNTQVHI